MAGNQNQSPDYLAENHDGVFTSVAAIFSIASLLTVLARLASKRLKNLWLQIDDWLLIIAWVVAVAECVLDVTAAYCVRLGWHLRVLNNAQLANLDKILYAIPFLHNTTLSLSKISLLVLLHRIFATRRFRLIVNVLGVVVIVYWLATVFASAFVCWPLPTVWDLNYQEQCEHQLSTLDIATPFIWIVTDLAILIAPIPVVRKLQMSSGKRIGLYTIFLFGGITCCVSVARFATLFYPEDDFTYDMSLVVILQMVEAHVTTACSALVAARPIIAEIVPKQPLSSLRVRLRLTSRTGAAKSTRPSRNRPHTPGVDADITFRLSAHAEPFSLQEMEAVRAESSTI